jgi:hypothetical protein
MCSDHVVVINRLLGAAVVFALLITASAAASQTPTTYRGTIASGGTVEFDVTGGTTVTRIAASPVMDECGLHPLAVVSIPGIPITNNAFTYSAPPHTFSGTLAADGTAKGSLQYRRETFPACTSPDRTWTATSVTTQPSPPSGPTMVLSGSTSQRARGEVVVGVAADAPCTATATGSLSVRRRSRAREHFTLRSATATLTPSVTSRLSLGVRPSARRAILRALRHGGSATARITVGVTDAASHSSVKKRTVRLHR